MRTVFFGTPDLAIPSLEAAAARHEVVAAVCQPDKPKGRSGKPAPPPVKTWAIAHGIPVCQPMKLNDGAFEAWLREQAPEMCVVAAYGRLLKQPILDVPPLGWLNMHPSLLPRWRGPSPIQTAMLEGDAVTGVTIMSVILEMDAGDILLQESTPIEPDENAEELGMRLGVLGGGLLAKGMEWVASGNARFSPQDPALVTVSKMFEKEHGRIVWAEPARRIHNRVRASVPWPLAHCVFRGEICRIHRTAAVEQPAGASPGTVTRVEKDRVLVAAGEGQLAILNFQMPGKKMMSMDAFLRGCPIAPGERFEDIV